MQYIGELSEQITNFSSSLGVRFDGWQVLGDGAIHQGAQDILIKQRE